MAIDQDLPVTTVGVQALHRQPASPGAGPEQRVREPAVSSTPESAPGGRAVPAVTEAEQVCELVRRSADLDLHTQPGPQLASLIRTIFGLEAVAIFDGDLEETYESGNWFPGFEESIRNIFIFETVSDDRETGLVRRVLRVRNLPIGALLLRGALEEITSDNIASLVSISFDRYHALAKELRLQSAREAERLRTTVLDNLAHAYKTPLTVIQAASSGLVEMGHLTPPQSAMVTLIAEQTEMLAGLTTRLLRTARLENHTLHTESVAILSLIEDAVAAAREQLGGTPVTVAVARENLTVAGDRPLLQAMLTQLVDNAGKYAMAGTPVTIEAAEGAQAVLLSVHNVGPVIPEGDRERIFDRYFRCCAPGHHAPGTGIGLSIARHAAQAHGGDVWVRSDAQHGTTFFASIPTAQPGAQA